MWQYQRTEELYHHGVLGMKWGVRRYQNANGTLTPAGRRKANKLAKQYAKVTGKKLIVKKKTVQGNEKQKPKTISEMSDAELQRKINRINLENNYARLLASQAPKPKISKGKKFINTVKKEVLAPAAIQAGKTAVTTMLTRSFDKMLKNTTKKTANNAKKQIKRSVNDYSQAVGKDAVQKAKDRISKNELGTITTNAKVIEQINKMNKKKK